MLEAHGKKKREYLPGRRGPLKKTERIPEKRGQKGTVTVCNEKKKEEVRKHVSRQHKHGENPGENMKKNHFH